MRTNPDAEHFVYRLFDADDGLLYVGCSSNVRARLSCHRAKDWGEQIASITVQGPWPRDAARFVESTAIHAEGPRHNVVYQRGPDLPDPAIQRAVDDFITSAHRVHRIYPQVSA